MASKRQAEMLLNNILKTAEIVKGLVGDNLEKINEHVKGMVDEFAEETKTKVVFSLSDTGELKSSIVDMKSDYVRTRLNTDKTMLSLKSKLFNVPIDIKVAKGEDVFSNKEVGEALAELSKIVMYMPVEMAKTGADDWSRELGAMPKSVSVTEEDDADEESSLGAPGQAMLGSELPGSEIKGEPSAENFPASESLTCSTEQEECNQSSAVAEADQGLDRANL